MTDNTILEKLQKFLAENIAPKIKLQKPNDDNVNDYILIHPAVHIGWIPPKLPEVLPAEYTPDIPCLIVGIDDGEDDGQSASLNIRISFATYSQGIYKEQGKCIPSFEGYKDLLNLITLTRIELTKAAVIEEVTSVERPFKWGIYQDQPYPYWYGWLTFSVTCELLEYVNTIEQQYL
jgi:hypothetical protein